MSEKLAEDFLLKFKESKTLSFKIWTEDEGLHGIY
tara:strand:- start:1747 stop:1851 length:105 start_codon:yes stop_codon:yes gene_type:complete